MKIEVSEVIGRVHFGVQKRASFLSFIEEPYTRFAVKSEVGGDYKLTDIPRVSNLIIQKIKKYIRNKVCFPKAYKTRVLWPKKWWPEGEDEYKESSSVKTVDTSCETAAVENNVTKEPTATSTSCVASNISLTDKSASNSISDKTSTGLLTSTGAAMRDNFSKWIIKPLLQGKQVPLSTMPPKRTARIGAGNDSDDETSEDEQIAILPILQSYRMNLLHTADMWEVIIKKAFYRGTGHDFIVIPSVAAALKLKNNASGFQHAVSFPNLAVRQKRMDGLPSCVLPTHSIDPADTIPCSMRRLAFMQRDFKAAHRAKSKLRTRSYSIDDFRSDSLALSSYHYFNYVSMQNHPDILSREEINETQMQLKMSKVSRISRTLAMRLSDVGALIQKRQRQLKYDRCSVKSSGNPKPLNRFHNDGFIFNTTPQQVDDPKDITENIAIDNNDSSRRKLGNFFRIGRQLEKAKDVLKSGLLRPDNRLLGTSAVDTTIFPVCTVESNYIVEQQAQPKATPQKIDSPVIEAVKIVLPHAIPSAGSKSIGDSPTSAITSGNRSSPTKVIDLEREAESLAWQARVQAITEASISGEYPSMQGFLLMKQNIPSCKKWIVLRQGNFGVFNSPADNTKYGIPLTHVNLAGAICRPATKSACCLEIGIPMENPPLKDPNNMHVSNSPVTPSVSFYWMPFWADSEVQCRAWVMAVQQSSLQLQEEKKKKEKA